MYNLLVPFSLSLSMPSSTVATKGESREKDRRRTAKEAQNLLWKESDLSRPRRSEEREKVKKQEGAREGREGRGQGRAESHFGNAIIVRRREEQFIGILWPEKEEVEAWHGRGGEGR